MFKKEDKKEEKFIQSVVDSLLKITNADVTLTWTSIKIRENVVDGWSEVVGSWALVPNITIIKKD